MTGFVKSFLHDERAVETVEWAVLAALIVAGVIAVVVSLGNNVHARFTELQNGTATP